MIPLILAMSLMASDCGCGNETVSTVSGCATCGEVTTDSCFSCGSHTYATGYCGSCERYSEGVPILENPEYTYLGYTELQSFSSCTAKLQCGNNYCYARIPLVNGCLPKLNVSRRADGCITGFRCDYSGKIPYRGGCPTYSRKKKVAKLPIAPAPTTVPEPKEEVSEEPKPDTVPIPKEEPSPSILKKDEPATDAPKAIPAPEPTPAESSPIPESPAPSTVPIPLPDTPSTVPAPNDVTVTDTPTANTPTDSADEATDEKIVSVPLCECDCCDCECECDCQCGCCDCGEEIIANEPTEERSDVGVMAGTMIFPHETPSFVPYTYPQLSHDNYPIRTGFSGGGWWGGGGGWGSSGTNVNPTPVVPEPSTFIMWAAFLFCLWFVKKVWMGRQYT